MGPSVCPRVNIYWLLHIQLLQLNIHYDIAHAHKQTLATHMHLYNIIYNISM